VSSTEQEGMCPLTDQHGSSHRNKRKDISYSCPDFSRHSSLEVHNKALFTTALTFVKNLFKKVVIAIRDV